VNPPQYLKKKIRVIVLSNGKGSVEKYPLGAKFFRGGYFINLQEGK
jgi:hypothetical protein